MEKNSLKTKKHLFTGLCFTIFYGFPYFTVFFLYRSNVFSLFYLSFIRSLLFPTAHLRALQQLAGHPITWRFPGTILWEKASKSKNNTNKYHSIDILKQIILLFFLLVFVGFLSLRVLLHLLRRCWLGGFGGLNPFSGGTWTLRETNTILESQSYFFFEIPL